MGMPLEQAFVSFEPKPLASASVGQVGIVVVVKTNLTFGIVEAAHSDVTTIGLGNGSVNVPICLIQPYQLASGPIS
jgi:hypothetical protein